MRYKNRVLGLGLSLVMEASASEVILKRYTKGSSSEVGDLVKTTGFPGMKVLQFAFQF